MFKSVKTFSSIKCVRRICFYSPTVRSNIQPAKKPTKCHQKNSVTSHSAYKHNQCIGHCSLCESESAHQCKTCRGTKLVCHNAGQSICRTCNGVGYTRNKHCGYCHTKVI